jgi:hypothetical protein
LGIYQLYWACVAWRLHFFNKWDYIANEFLLVILGQTNYEKFLAENQLVDVMVINNLKEDSKDETIEFTYEYDVLHV